VAGLDLGGLESALAAGRPPAPVYLLLGPGVWAREQAVALLRAAALGGEADGPGAVLRVRAGETDLVRVLDSASTLPMGMPRRLIILTDLEVLAVGDLELLAEYASRPCATTCLVLAAAQLAARSRAAKSLLAGCARVECAAPRSYEIPGWLAGELRRRQRRCEPGVPELLQEILGDDQAALAAGLEKVLLYLGDGPRPVAKADVAAVLDRLPHGTVWEFVEALEEKDAPRALQALAAILELGEPPESVLRLVLRSRRQLLAGLAAKRQGADPDAVLAAMGVHPKARAVPRLRQAILARLSAHREGEVVAAMPRLLDVDSRLKGGGGEPAPAALARLVLDLVGSGGPPRS
jgi:DNA polymerase III delta subunit